MRPRPCVKAAREVDEVGRGPLFALTGRVVFFLAIASIAAFASSLFLLKPRLTPSVAG